MKDKAENVGHKIQEKAESAGIMPPLHQRRADEKQGKSDKPKNLGVSATSLTMEIARQVHVLALLPLPTFTHGR